MHQKLLDGSRSQEKLLQLQCLLAYVDEIMKDDAI
jgi:hypothetical protein